MSFGKAFLSSCLGALTALILFFVLGFIFFASLVSGVSSDEPVAIDDNAVLHLKLDAQINEIEVEDPFEGLPVFGERVQKIGLVQLKSAIKHASENDKVKGIFLEIGYPMTGFSTLEEIRQSLADFRAKGKWIISYNEVMSETAYYLASVADQVYLHPEGEVEFNGLSAEVTFLKKMFDKLEIKPQVFRVGEFKSAVEPFLRENMSDENRLQLTEMLNSIHDQVLTRVAASRSIEKSRLREMADQMLVRNASDALNMNLVDSLLYDDELQQVFRKRLGLGEQAKINFVKYNKYKKAVSTYKSSPNEIAVIVAEGTIMPGDASASENIIAADTYVKEIRRAREDKDVKAIVIRINSPGGEFRSSDMMWREIELAKKSKPVIASMSDYAASGGYYMAMGCDTIVAQPHTITGSIGIFGVMFDLSGFLGNKIGITFEEVKTGKFGEIYTVSRPLNPEEQRFIQKNLEDHYNTFTSKAAQGRGMPQEDLLKVASGRVWTGAQAKERNLVDVLGGFDDALKLAAEKAGVASDYKVRYYPKKKPFFEELISNLEENAKADQVKNELGDFKVWYDQIQRIKTYQGAQARMPYEMTIH